MSTCLRVRVRVDMNIDYIDEKAVMTYIACLCDALHCRSAAAAAAAVRRQEVRNNHRPTAFTLNFDIPETAVLLETCEKFERMLTIP